MNNKEWRKKMKKSFTGILIILCIVFLVGCRNESDSGKETNITTLNSKRFIVNFPGTGRSVNNTSKNEISYFNLTFINNGKEIQSIKGLPGETVTVKVNTEEEMVLRVTAFNSYGDITAEIEKDYYTENTNQIIRIMAKPLIIKSESDFTILDFDNKGEVENRNLYKMVRIKGNEILNDFYICNVELTYAKWFEVYTWANNNGYICPVLGKEGGEGDWYSEDDILGTLPTGSLQPVTNVSWESAILWCNAASEKEGFEPVYYIEGTTDFSDNSKVLREIGKTEEGESTLEICVVNPFANGYRLPTIEEWEYAARAGKNYIYSGSNNIDEVAWYSGNSYMSSHEVGLKKPNNYGLYDMSGNVDEWCWDSDLNIGRYNRGGSWFNSAGNCRIIKNSACNSKYFDNTLGFRVVRSGNK